MSAADFRDETIASPARYTGRFAPSPTGPLHFGSLVAAAASYLQARQRNGRWLLRIEDIDPPREQPGADKLILSALESFGFEWDGPVLYQSASTDRHQSFVQQLIAAGHAYACSCSRRDLADVPRGPLGSIYPGTCRSGSLSGDTAIRCLTTDQVIGFDDALQGHHEQRLESESGDFVILRRDGLVAYHLAVVVDDYDQEVTEIVRGIDLLDSTPRHIWLQQLLGFTTPDYVHIPVIVNRDGQKLSKLTGAPAISGTEPRVALLLALKALSQCPPEALGGSSLHDIWQWAIENWDPGALQSGNSIAEPRVPYG